MLLTVYDLSLSAFKHLFIRQQLNKFHCLWLLFCLYLVLMLLLIEIFEFYYVYLIF